MTPRSFLVGGLLAGLLTGLAIFAVSYVAGEPYVDSAIAREAAIGSAADGHRQTNPDARSDGKDAEEQVVSRSNQRTWGLLTASLAVSVAVGGLTALTSAFAVGRLGRLSPVQSTAVVASVGFVALGLVPFLVYPANPPSVGDPATIGTRTGAYFGLLAISVLGAVGSVVLAVRVGTRMSGYMGLLAGAAAYLVLVVVATFFLPAASPVGDFPADTLWGFRRASLLTQLTMWSGLGLVLTYVVSQLHRQEQALISRRELAASL
jgi:hypothetical protein